MLKQVRRGFVETDLKEFGKEQMAILKRAQEDICILLERGYEIDKCIVFVGNHYCLSSRQRKALLRAASDKASICLRREKEWRGDLKGKTILIDGFNLIITLEVALSESSLLLCMDNTVRDIAGLHGTYRIIDKTQTAVSYIADILEEMEIGKAVFYFDSPVSNSGKLKQMVLEILENYSFDTEAYLVTNADVCLRGKEFVVSSDAIILNECKSYINLSRKIIEKKIENFHYIDLSKVEYLF